MVIPEDEDWEKEWDAWQQQLWQGWLKETPPELYRQKYSKESFAGSAYKAANHGSQEKTVYVSKHCIRMHAPLNTTSPGLENKVDE